MKTKNLLNYASIICVSLTLFSCTDDEPGTNAAGPSVLETDAVIAQENDISLSEALPGIIRPDKHVVISSDLPRKVTAVQFVDGSFVKKGSVLFLLENSDIIARRKQVLASLELAVATEKRLSELVEKGTVSVEEYDNALTNLKSVRATLEQVDSELAKTVIRAPFSGKIGISKVQVGSFVTPGSALVDLMDIETLKVEFYIPEKYANSPFVGNEINYTIHADSVLTGKAIILYSEPLVDKAKGGVLVQAIFKNETGRILPGVFAKVDFNLAQKSAKGIHIPTHALIAGGDGYSVFVHKNGKAAVKPVKIRDRNESTVIVSSGLDAGDTVLTSNTLKMFEGADVKVVSITQK